MPTQVQQTLELLKKSPISLEDALRHGIKRATFFRHLRQIELMTGKKLLISKKDEVLQYFLEPEIPQNPSRFEHASPALLQSTNYLQAFEKQRSASQHTPKSAGVLREIFELMAEMLNLPGFAPSLMKMQLNGRIIAKNHAFRSLEIGNFAVILSAIAEQQRIQLNYHSRSSNQNFHWMVSPQRVIHYRENWYLDVLIHSDPKQLRRLSLDRCSEIIVTSAKAKLLSAEELNQKMQTGYGVTLGNSGLHKAILKIHAPANRWLLDEKWDSSQIDSEICDRFFVRSIEFADPNELAMEILRHSPHIEIIEPTGLKTLILERLDLARARNS